MKKTAFALMWLVFFNVAATEKDTLMNTYQFSLDLTQVKEDKLMVNLVTPRLDVDEVIYRIPKIVPGTYEIYDFGRFISDFNVYDTEGKLMEYEKADINSWKIKNAKRMRSISYMVDDTWDTPVKESFVFEPGGTNIQENKNFV